MRKIIIDTDPGVDDATSLVVALNSDEFDIKLITTTYGNVGIEKTTKNALFLVNKFNKNINVAKGSSHPMQKALKSAINVHGKNGLGNLEVPSVDKKAIKENAIDEMYKIIKENKGEITLVELAPQTNLGQLFTKYPDCESMVKEIIFEGGSPYGKEGVKPHISFNISSDPDACDIVLKTKIKKTIIPSEMGRYIAPFSKEQIEKIKTINETGELLYSMYRGYKSDCIRETETNDLCTIMYMLYPEIFKTYNCEISLDTKVLAGRMFITQKSDGDITFVEDVDRDKFFELFIQSIKKIN